MIWSQWWQHLVTVTVTAVGRGGRGRWRTPPSRQKF